MTTLSQQLEHAAGRTTKEAGRELFSAVLARARDLDAEHRAETGRPISRDNLRARLRIGRDRASALVAAIRAEAAARAAPGPVSQAA